MKKWWKSFQLVVIFLIAVFIVAPLIVLFLMYINDTAGTNRIIYDAKKQEIISEVGYFAWLKDRAAQERYFILAEKITITDTVTNIAYRAKFIIPMEKQAVRKFLTEDMLKTHESYIDLHKTASRCVSQLGQRSYDVEGYSSMTVRSMSIGKMNELCPIASRFGYEWLGNLEIVQCNEDLPLDNARKNDCLNSARLSHY